MSDNFVKVASTKEIPPGEMKTVQVANESILIINVGGTFHAVSEICTHAECTLSDGYLDNETLECSCHGAQFNVTTGAVESPPAYEDLPVFPIRVEGNDIFVSA